MRMIALALIAFLFAGISLGISRIDFRALATDFRLVERPDLAFEASPTPQSDPAIVSLSRAYPKGVLFVSDTTPAQTAQYYMLQDAAVASGVLKLHATTQISDGQNNVLRVLVDNQPRSEILLRPGQHTVKSEIGLTSDELAAEKIAIRYVLVTPSDEGSCHQDTHAANVIEIEYDTQIELSLNDEVLTTRDRIATWGNEIRIGWPSWLADDQRQERATHAMQLAALGYTVRLVDAPDSDVLSVTALSDLVAEGGAHVDLRAIMPQWPEEIAVTGANAGLRNFHESATWRHWYRIGATEHASAPSALEYELLLGPLPFGSSWTVVATHNGSVLDIQQVRGGIQTVDGRLSLDDALFESNNVVEITATSDYEPVGVCNDGPLLQAELRQSSRLLGGGPTYDADLSGIRSALMHDVTVTIDPSFDLSVVEAQRMLAIIDRLTPSDAELVLGDFDSMVTAVRRSDLDAAIADASPTDYVAWLDEDDRLAAVPASNFRNGTDLMEFGTLALIVRIEATEPITTLNAE